MKKSLLILAFFLMAVAIFQFYPEIEYKRLVVPEYVHAGKSCDCDCISKSRPWLSRFNYWFWFWIVIVPVLISFIKEELSKWQKSALYIITVLICYGSMNLAVHLMWEIANGPFIVSSDPAFPYQETWEMSGCANIADGASMVFAMFLGWIPACIYVALWFLIRKSFQCLLKKLYI